MLSVHKELRDHVIEPNIYKEYTDYTTTKDNKIFLRIDNERTVIQMMSLSELVLRLVTAGFIVGNRNDNKFSNEKNIDYILDNSNNGIIVSLSRNFDFYNKVLSYE